MNACPRLETDRLILRPFIDGDVDDYFAVLNTAEVRQALHLSESLDRSDAWQQNCKDHAEGLGISVLGSEVSSDHSCVCVCVCVCATSHCP